MADIVPDEMYVLFHHDGQVGRFSDFEEVQWTKDDEYYIDEPGPSFFYSRQGGDGGRLPFPTEDAWRKFLERIEEAGVFSWVNGEGDEDQDMLVGYDPPVWTFEIHRPGVEPFERKGPIDKLPPNFDRFCEALSELMGGQKFGPE